MYNYYPNYGYDRNNLTNYQGVNNNLYPNGNQEFYPEAQDERFFFAPFLVGGLAGTALGYGIANNNQLNNNQQQGCCGQPVMYFQPPVYPYPYMYSSNNNFYY